MAIKAIVTKDEHGKLDASNQALYVEREGKLVLDVVEVDGYALKDVGNLMTALSTERKTTKDLNARLEAVADLDPIKAREALTKVEKMSSWTPQDKLDEKIAARETQLTQKHATELKAKDERLSKMDGQVRKLLITSESLRVIGDKGSPELLLPIFERMTKVEEDSAGNFVARVVDPNGNVRITTRSGSTDPMSIEELGSVLQQDPKYAGAWNGSGASGSGASGSARGGSGALKPKTVRASDTAAVGANLQAIASGEVTVLME